MRPSWDQYFMDITRLVATRATCPRRAVGAVLVKNKQIISTGYNGSPPGQPHCTDIGCIIEENTDRCIRTLHAEQNAILQAALHGTSPEGSTLYVTCRPCTVCARLVAGAKIAKIVYLGDAPEGWIKQVLDDARIECIQFGEING